MDNKVLELIKLEGRIFEKDETIGYLQELLRNANQEIGEQRIEIKYSDQLIGSYEAMVNSIPSSRGSFPHAREWIQNAKNALAEVVGVFDNGIGVSEWGAYEQRVRDAQAGNYTENKLPTAEEIDALERVRDGVLYLGANIENAKGGWADMFEKGFLALVEDAEATKE